MVILPQTFDCKPGVVRGAAAIEQLVRWKRRAGFDAEHLMLNYSMFEGKGGEDPRANCFKNFHGYREDWLGEYLPIARRHGLRVLIYFNCHWVKPDAFPADYYVVDAAGKPKVIYGDGGEICCRGPYREWSETIAEDLGRYPIDGVFLDGPVKDSCWCPHCRAAFQARYGRALPDTPPSSPTERNDYEAFLTEMPVDYMRAFARGLHRHNSDAVLYCNGGDSRQTKASLRCTQLVGEEGGFIGYEPLTGVFPFCAGLAAKKLESRARGRARVVFCDPNFKRYDYHLHPLGEVARTYAGTIANGANPWFGVNRDVERSPAIQTVYRFNRLVHEQRAALTNGESLAEAAILESPLNLQLAGAIQAASGDDVHKRDAAAQRLAVPRHGDEFHGLYAALARSGYPFDIVEDDHLLDGTLPPRIKLLVLPGVGAMSDGLAERVREFVARGGRLLATFDTSLYDEDGARRADFALADVFGAGVQSELNGPSDLDYLGVKNRSALTIGISQNILPCPERWWLVKASTSAKPLVHYFEKMPRRYAALPPLSKSPAVLLNRFGKGMAIFIPSTIGQLSLRYRFPDIRLLLRNAARFLTAPPVTVEGGDEFVETTLRRSATDDIVVHLINWASGERPSSAAIPLGPLRVSVRLPRGARRPKSVELAMAGRSAKASMNRNVVTFTLSCIEEYEMGILA